MEGSGDWKMMYERAMKLLQLCVQRRLLHGREEADEATEELINN